MGVLRPSSDPFSSLIAPPGPLIRFGAALSYLIGALPLALTLWVSDAGGLAVLAGAVVTLQLWITSRILARHNRMIRQTKRALDDVRFLVTAAVAFSPIGAWLVDLWLAAPLFHLHGGAVLVALSLSGWLLRAPGGTPRPLSKTLWINSVTLSNMCEDGDARDGRCTAMAVRRSQAKRDGLASVVQVRLSPTPEQADALQTAVAVCNAAATFVSRLAWQVRTFTVVELHRLAYYPVRAQLPGLGAQAAVRAIARVAGAYANRRSSRKRAHVFRPLGAVPFDARMLTFHRDARTLSIWTPTGRLTLAYTGREADLKAIESLPIGEADLVCRNGVWLLQVAVTLPKPEVVEPINGFVGVDQGIANLAVTSDGTVLPGNRLPGTIDGNGHVRGLRERRHRQRRRLQKRRTSAARRVLRRLSGREHRMMTDLNHQISTFVVREAERTGRGIALEDLQGIRSRVRAHRLQRRTLHNWAFAQQTAFTRYKAVRAGIAFVLVDPAYTSQCCPGCGCVSRANRPARGRFVCTGCGLAGHADHIAAINIAKRGVDGWGFVNIPHATGLLSARWDRESKPPGSPGGR